MGKRRSGKKPLPIIEVEVTPRKARKCENMSLCTRASVLQIRISSESGSLERDGSRRVEVRRVRYKYEKDMSWERETHSHTPRKTALVKIANREWEDMTARPFTSSNFWVLRLPAHAHTQVSHPRQPFTPLELPLQPPSGPIIIILVFDRVKFCFVLLFYETVYIEVVQFNPTFRNWVLQKKNLFGASFPLRDFRMRNTVEKPRRRKYTIFWKLHWPPIWGYFLWHGWVARRWYAHSFVASES